MHKLLEDAIKKAAKRVVNLIPTQWPENREQMANNIISLELSAYDEKVNALVETAGELLETKRMKDEHGKSEQYERRREIAWIMLSERLKTLHHPARA